MTPSGARSMSTGALHTWIKRPLTVWQRLGRLGPASLFFVRWATRQHARPEAARCSGLPPALLSPLVPSHAPGASRTLEQRSTSQARKIAQALERVRGLPWTLLLILDAPGQSRARLHPDNAN